MKMPVRVFGISRWCHSLGSAKWFPFWNPYYELSFDCSSVCLAAQQWLPFDAYVLSQAACAQIDGSVRTHTVLGIGKYSSICFNAIETFSKTCKFGKFVWGGEDGTCVSSELGQHAAMTDGLGQPSSRERHLCLGGHVRATSLSSHYGLYCQQYLES